MVQLYLGYEVFPTIFVPKVVCMTFGFVTRSILVIEFLKEKGGIFSRKIYVGPHTVVGTTYIVMVALVQSRTGASLFVFVVVCADP